MNNKTIFISVAAFIGVIFIAAVGVYKSQQPSTVASEQLPALERIGAPSKGGKQAKVTIVEFFDPACGTCSQFYPLINNLVKKYQGKVNVVMRYAPLHKGSDNVVKMLEAAHLQGEFWPALELLFANQQRWVEHHVSNPTRALAGIKTLNVDHDQLDTDWQSSNIAKIIAQDIKDGQTLKVRATPQFFVNGKPLVVFGYEELVYLVEEAVAEAY
ncbi:thioredoxin domain-containing protein [Colwellia psychrerythraea]|uniref:DsbA-like thioredoxin domain protein n=1 Tax=Colwellia psychrerythraea (strain 34H / ATCC BAA-681) TaxID=167879 RepID=Q480V6_COLP3|nr:thioredoxin domain-containing protein [Colwellia psychrerythraea]AAZ25521.1 dsbA-like thioredoxin domain protein [Colwellia psychrerythraea 34H]